MNIANHSALDVAKWFIYKNHIANEIDDADDVDDISNMKLQKLLYYAQGTFLAMTGQPLFREDILAWTHGPVVYEVWQEYTKNGKVGIPYTTPPQEQYTDEDNDILCQVYECFGQYTAWKLRQMTHQETPWKNTKHNEVIDINVIRDFFRAEYVET